MHGNTETVSNYKTRRYDNIRAEVGDVRLPSAILTILPVVVDRAGTVCGISEVQQ